MLTEAFSTATARAFPNAVGAGDVAHYGVGAFAAAVYDLHIKPGQVFACVQADGVVAYPHQVAFLAVHREKCVDALFSCLVPHLEDGVAGGFVQHGLLLLSGDHIVEPHHGNTVADLHHLVGLALAAVRNLLDHPGGAVADCAQLAVELKRVPLVGGVFQHPCDLSALDLPGDLAAEVEVFPVASDGPARGIVQENAVLGSGDYVGKVPVIAGENVDVGHPVNGRLVERRGPAGPSAVLEHLSARGMVGLAYHGAACEAVDEDALVDEKVVAFGGSLVIEAEAAGAVLDRAEGADTELVRSRNGGGRSCPASRNCRRRTKARSRGSGPVRADGLSSHGPEGAPALAAG
ncbi:MAG: hypothetical protein MZV64_36975 [Ignavibacteriales bacterium]|nr:hypothetical protein [Ignavibacteriales bacterium]